MQNIDLVDSGLIVATLALVQSVFGIGLLILGTPTLLLLGMPFEQALWVLLPASLTISTLQLVCDRGLNAQDLRRFVIFAIPPLAVGLLIALKGRFIFKVEAAVGLLLVVGAVLRLSRIARKAMASWFSRHELAALGGIGLVHGLTNMGGSLLSLYASIRHSSKWEIRQHIALGYATFAATQLILLSVLSTQTVRFATMFTYMLIAGLVFLTAGRFAFQKLESGRYNVYFSVFEISCGSSLIVKSAYLRLLSI